MPYETVKGRPYPLLRSAFWCVAVPTQTAIVLQLSARPLRFKARITAEAALLGVLIVPMFVAPPPLRHLTVVVVNAGLMRRMLVNAAVLLEIFGEFRVRVAPHSPSLCAARRFRRVPGALSRSKPHQCFNGWNESCCALS